MAAENKNNQLKQGKQNQNKHIQNRQAPNPQKQRARNLCSVHEKCGGCQLLHMTYEEQLFRKQKEMKELLKGICPVEPIIGMEKPEHYRNKVNATFALDRKGMPICGIYQEGTHKVVSVEQCLLENEKADAIIQTIRGLLKSFRIKTYDEDSGYGLLRHVQVRVGHASGEIMVVLVLTSPILPSKNNFVKALRKEHPEITTVVLNINDRKTSAVLGERNIVLFGKGYIEDTLCEKTFRISPKSFYQVNSVQTEYLYRKAIEFAGLNGTETVIDAYCGIGTVGLIASGHAGRVIGVELNKDAVRDANINQKRNGILNAKFYQGDAGEFMRQMAEDGETVDVVFMDPPRAGSTELFMDSVAVLHPKRVVYISCNPQTLKRDLEYFRTIGYKARKAIPVDMFPFTVEIENVVLLEKVR